MYRSITMSEFSRKLGNEPINLIDVRELDEWEEGHIEGAMHIPVSDFQRGMKVLDKKKVYYVMCHSGNRSAMVSDYLGKMGYQVVNILGGISAYNGKLV